jgi:glucose-6-phosphate-specific signal transduction histidine kinase
LSTFNRPLRGRWSIGAHAVELALICLIIIYTEGPTSPFFIYFTFVLLTAALRWQWQGALVTGAFLSLVLIVLTVSAFIVHFEQSEIDRLLIRNIYLIVASGLFAFLGDQLGRNRIYAERLQLARELHDGILQTLTAVGLKLHTVAARTPSDQRESLLEVDQLLNDEQRGLRAFVEESRHGQSERVQSFRTKDLQRLVDQLKRLWNCEIDFELKSTDASIQPILGSPLKFIISESVANAVTHGGANHVAIAIAKDAKALSLQIKDNGSGFANADGEYDDATIAATGIGPRSIRERVASLHGSLCLRTSTDGTELQIKLPILGPA